MQLVVLAGGLGTRLNGAIPDGLPKPMAPIAGRPFLEHLLDRAIAQGVEDVQLLVGHAAEVISRHFGNSYRGVSVGYCVEDVPLGTGGALKAAESRLQAEFLFANGDTFANVNFCALLGLLGPSPLSLSLAGVDDASRYGSVITEADVVVGFREKGLAGGGYVNAGVYACRRDLIDLLPIRSSFSFEADFLEPELPNLRPQFLKLNAGIIDIGTPESYALANAQFDSK